MIDVIPGILEQEFPEIEKKIRLVEPYVSWVQIDVLDGTLFNNSCFHDPKPFADLDTQLLMEAHLMVKNPVRYVESYYTAGFERFIAHVEAFDEAQAKGFVDHGEEKENVFDFINICRQFNAETALAIDLPTPVEDVFPYLESLDQVLVMAINTGKSGQKFEESALEKIKAIRAKDPYVHIEVDGGVNPETAKKAVEAGATRLSANSSIFQSQNMKDVIEKLRQSG